MDSEDGKKAIQLVLNAKNIFIIIGMILESLIDVLFMICSQGAGVSVAAGIPAFRGSDGSYNDIDMKLPPGKVVKDIMSAGIKKVCVKTGHEKIEIHANGHEGRNSAPIAL